LNRSVSRLVVGGVSLIACAALIQGCAKNIPEGAAVWERLPAPTKEAVLLGTSEDEATGGVALWQGFELGWGYNHRINRIGSTLEQSVDGCPHDGGEADKLCTVKWRNTGASGTGPDTAGTRTYLELVSAQGVGFSTVTQELIITGKEDTDLTAEMVVEVPLSAMSARMPHHVAVLNGFDLLALDSADKFMDFELAVGEPTIEGEIAKVPVTAKGQFSCSSPECPMTDEVDYSIQVAVLVVSGTPESLETSVITTTAEYDWDSSAELDESVHNQALSYEPPERTRALAFQSFKIDLDRELHMLQFGMHVSGNPEMDLRFKNWRKGMKNEAPPGSYTAYREEGGAKWEANVIALDFAKASLVPLSEDGQIKWRGWGRDANSDEAVIDGELKYAQRTNYDPPEGSTFGTEDVGETRGAFDPILRALKKGRDRQRLEPYCNDGSKVDLAADGQLASRLQQVLLTAQLLDELGPAALSAEAVSFQPDEGDDAAEEGAEAPDSRIVLAKDIAIEGREFGGLVHIRDVKGGQEVWGEDWWTRDAAKLGTQLDGAITVNEEGTLFDGVVWQTQEGDAGALLPAFSGTITHKGDKIVAKLLTPCGEDLAVSLTTRDAGECASLDGGLASGKVSSGKASFDLAFDDACDSCNRPEGTEGDETAQVCFK